ncbi:MAG: carbonic anhydrase family protein [Rhizobiales bacterium]|nr:carbonic anhydrase family protein [Hyphomicrobiales bacterium]
MKTTSCLLAAGIVLASPFAAYASGTTDGHSSASKVFGSKDDGHGAEMKVSKVDTNAHGNSAAAPAGKSHGSQWGYSGAAGPDFWGNLKNEYAVCGTGKMQSPINISGGLSVIASDIEFNYSVSDLTIRNNGHTVQVDYNPGSSIEVNGEQFNLLQFHFHTPSENLIDGKTYPMEMHLVHQNSAGQLAVVGVMMEYGERNIALAEIWNHLPEHAGAPTRIHNVAMNARDLLPITGNYHHFMGSLTTPPCSEGVNWYVLSEPVQASADQIGMFTAIIGENARPAQPTHNRMLISGN